MFLCVKCRLANDISEFEWNQTWNYVFIVGDREIYQSEEWGVKV